MDRETRGALARLDEQMKDNSARMEAGFARTDARMDEAFARMETGFARMETGFARMDRFVELQQAQHQDHVRLTAAGFDAVQRDMQSLRAEFSSFRDWVTSQIAELRTWLRELTR